MNTRRKQRHARSHAPSWGIIIIIFALCVAVYGGYKGVQGIIDTWLEDLPSVENSDAFNYAEKTHVYANDGTTLLASFYLENREPVTIDQISPYVLQGTVDTEDVRFYEHDGIDLHGMARALVTNLTGGELEGASTITQQFVRNTILFDEMHEITFERKVREMQLALDLEKLYTKDEILLMYLNTINYGDGAYGIEAAARNYFQKSALELTLAEAATLVGIPQSPTYLNPKNNPDATLKRRNLVLDRMLTAGHITQEEHDAAAAEPLLLNPAPERSIDGIYAFPYFTSYVRNLLTEQYSNETVWEGGLTVYTTIDPNLQNMAEIASQNQYERMDWDMEASLTCVDPNTGYILAMVGGKDYEANEWNIATQGQRQGGSTFKAFTLVTAIEQGINPQTLIDCSGPMTVNGTTIQNFGNASYGVQTIQYATAISSNTGFVRLVQQVTPQNAVQTAYRMGLKSEQPVVESVTLGAGPVNTLELASAFGTLADGGLQRDPVAITQILDKDGNTIFQHQDSPIRALTPEVAYAATKVLRTVYTQGTATAAQLSSGQPAAGKTGTSNDFKDHLLVGYTPQLSCAVWIGNPDNTPTDSWLDCSAYWRDFMTMALEGRPVEDFETAGDPPYNNAFNEKQANELSGKTAEERERERLEGAPNTIGMTLSDAANALAGFEAEYIEEYSATAPVGTVIGQSVVGNKVRLVVSKGPDPNPQPTQPTQPTEPTDPTTPTDNNSPPVTNNP